MRLFTVGHSNRDLAALIALVRGHGIAHIVDVRRQPASRRLPHFNRAALQAGLAAAGLDYTWLEALGGRREPVPGSPHAALEGPLAGYADHMATPAFAAGIARLDAIAADAVTAVMCAEADPAHCHRALLCDFLVARGDQVLHAVSPAAPDPHALSPLVRIDGGVLVYDRGQRSLF